MDRRNNEVSHLVLPLISQGLELDIIRTQTWCANATSATREVHSVVNPMQVLKCLVSHNLRYQQKYCMGKICI
jgi:hypothetical protein